MRKSLLPITSAVLLMAIVSIEASANAPAKLAAEGAAAAAKAVSPALPSAGAAAGAAASNAGAVSAGVGAASQGASLFDSGNVLQKVGLNDVEKPGMCAGNPSFLALPKAVLGTVNRLVQKGWISAKNECLPQFQAAGKAVMTKVSDLVTGFESANPKFTAKMAESTRDGYKITASMLKAAILKMTAREKKSFEDGLERVASVCNNQAHQGDNACLFGPAVCNSQVLGAVAAGNP